MFQNLFTRLSRNPSIRALIQWVDADAGIADGDAETEPTSDAEERRIDWFRIVPFIFLHLGCLGVFWTGASAAAATNHHHYAVSARQGFRWWELDLTYLGLRLLERFGIVRELRPVPARILAEEKIGTRPAGGAA